MISSYLKFVGVRLIFPISTLVLWEAIVISQAIPNTFLPAPSSIFSTALRLVSNCEICSEIASTVYISLVSAAIALCIGVFFGVLIGLNDMVRNIFMPSIDVIRTLPPVALLPVFIIGFGLGTEMKIIFVLSGSIWPVLLNTINGANSVDPIKIKMAKNLGYNSYGIITKVVLPLSLPSILVGLKLTMALSLILTIVSEMLTGGNGLGAYINYMKRSFLFPEMFATILIVGIIGFLYSTIVSQIEKKVSSWDK